MPTYTAPIDNFRFVLNDVLNVGDTFARLGLSEATPDLLDAVRTSFVHGMDLMLWICGGIALGCALLAVIVLKTRRTDAGTSAAETGDGSLTVL